MTEEATDTQPRELSEELREEIRATYAVIRNGVPGFKTRRSQSMMIGAVSRALGTPNGVAVVEAPTGTGKSLAYLISAIPIAQAHKLKLVISTGTVALQEQLVNRDIPNFLKTSKFPLRMALAKGRGRFACIRDMRALATNSAQNVLQFSDDEAVQGAAWDRPPQPGERELVVRLFDALMMGKWDGDLDVTPEPVADELRPMLTTTGGACAGRRCADYGQCPFVRARAGVDAADVIVVNHALLMADLQLSEDGETPGGVLLPSLSECLLVADEGHHLADVARESNAATLATAAYLRRRTKVRNVLRACYQALGKDKVASHSLEDGHSMLDDVDAALDFFDGVVRLQWVPDPDDSEPLWRAPLGVVPKDWRSHLVELRSRTERALRWVTGVRRAVLDGDLPPNAQEALPRELGITIERLAQKLRLWELWLIEDAGAPTARWITLDKSGSLVIHACPVSAADFLADAVFKRAAGVVVTSATISAGGNFDAVERSLGLPAHAETVSLPSPFDIPNQGKLVIPRMRTLPSDRDAHNKEVAEILARDLDWSKGNLVLFTSKSAMTSVYEQLPASRKALVLMQGTNSKAKILSTHAAAIAQGKGSTIFGSSSFGEGVDLVGGLCSTVVINKLPFQQPDDPVAATYNEWLEAQGLRPFDEVTVPDAIQVLTQWLGRLIRTENDSGECWVLDRRLADKSFGRRMLKALPPFRRAIAS